MQPKSIWKSKTFYTNILMGVVGGAGLATDVIPPKYAPAVVATGAIANVLLRLLTNTAIA